MKTIVIQASILISSLLHLVFSISNSQFKLNLINSRYALQLVLGSQKTPIELIIDSGLSTSLVNAASCLLCQRSNTKNYDPTTSTNSKVITQDAIIKRRKYQYNGTAYEDTFAINDLNNNQFSGINAFVSIVNISLTNEISESGFISINYFSDIFKMIKQKKYITLEFSDSEGKMTIGDIDPDVIDTTNLVYYPIKPIPEEKIMYFESSILLIKSELYQPHYANNQKLLIDTTTWDFHIPNKFFFANLETIIPIPCQVQLNGQFICSCAPKDLNSFPSFHFTIGGNVLEITPAHYLTYDTSGSNCLLHMNVNYYSEYWIVGMNLLNKNITLLDYESAEPRMAFVAKKEQKKSSTTTFIIIFVSVAVISCLLFVGGYFLYKKFYLLGNNNNNNNIGQGNNHQNHEEELLD